jgi:hypothetical protein
MPLYPTPFYDVNGDGRVTAADALAVINELNAGRGGAVVAAAGDDDQSIVATPMLAAPLQTASTVVAPILEAATADRGVPLASSLDVTPLAISVASSGSTAVAPVLAAAESKRRESSAAVARAIVDLYSGDHSSNRTDGSTRSTGTPVSPEAVDAVFIEEHSADDKRSFVIDRPTPVGAGRAAALESTLEEIGLEPVGRKKKWRIHNI